MTAAGFSSRRGRCLLAPVAALGGLLIAACGGGPGEGAPIEADAAHQALSSAFDGPLVVNVITAPKATTSQIVESFTGGSEYEHLVAVVFANPRGTRLFTGGDDAHRIGGRDHVAVIRVANVVVMYTRARGVFDRAPELRRALLSACDGCGAPDARFGQRNSVTPRSG